VKLKKFIVGAPFGNYLQPKNATPTVGTYTLRDRAGFMRWRILWRVMRTLRWHFGLGWTNRLGLPNPGIAHARALWNWKQSYFKDKIVSIHGLEPNDWGQLLYDVAQLDPLAVELNVSCPNVGHLSVPENLFETAAHIRSDDAGFPFTIPVIVKLPPVNYWETFKLALAGGLTTFHCCNTLPVPAGGLSGKPLKRVSLDVIKRIKDHYPEATIVGGGGITTPEDVADYASAGASHFAVASAFLHPLRALSAQGWLAKLGAELDWEPPRFF
jgi:dihydroorotate dehydrogenase